MVETSFRYVRVESTSRLQMDVTYRTTLVTDVVCNAQKQYNSPLQLAYGQSSFCTCSMGRVGLVTSVCKRAPVDVHFPCSLFTTMFLVIVHYTIPSFPKYALVAVLYPVQ